MGFGRRIERALRRFRKKFWTGTGERIRARVEPLEGALRDVDVRLQSLETAWQQHIPSFLNAVSTTSAFGHELARAKNQLDETQKSLAETQKSLGETQKSLEGSHREIHLLWNRLEFSRKEMMFEMKYGRSASEGPAAEVNYRIVDPEKVARLRLEGLKLNLGCGHIPLDGYVNVDRRDLPGIDVIGDVGDLPFEQNSIVEIFSSHVLEHFPQELLLRLLPYWRSLLAPGGTFRAIVPDGAAMLAKLGEGSYAFEDFRMVLFGAQEYDGDFHFNLLTPESLTRLLDEAGFEDIRVPVAGRKNDICFEFEIQARRG